MSFTDNAPRNPWTPDPGSAWGFSPRPPAPPQPRSMPPLQQLAQAMPGMRPMTPRPPDNIPPPSTPLAPQFDEAQEAEYQPYINARGDRPPNEWGTDDDITTGIGNYRGGLPPGPHAPQYQDIPGLIRRMTMFWGQNGSMYTAGPAISMGMSSDRYMKDFAAGQLARAQLEHQRFTAAMQETLARQTEELKEEKDYFAIYGPHQKLDKDGQPIEGEYDPGDWEKFNEAIRVAAKKYGDKAMEAALDTGDFGAVQRLLAERDGNNQDLARTIKMREKEEEERKKYDPYQVPKGQPMPEKERGQEPQDTPVKPPQVAPSQTAPPGSPGATPAQPPESGPAGPAPAGKPAPDEESPLNFDLPLSGNEGESTGTPTAAPAPPIAPPGAVPPPPSLDAAQAQPQQPIQMAGGPVSDAPIAGLGPVAQAPSQTPTAQPSVPGQPAPQATSPPPASASTYDDSTGTYGWSETHRKAFQHHHIDPNQLEGFALQSVNGTMRAEQWRSLPKGMQQYVLARKNEIEAEQRRLLNSNLDSKEVARRLKELNPEFYHTLQGYIDGSLPVPKSAWANPSAKSYMNMVIGFGKRIDPTFNAQTAVVRNSVKIGFANGQDARNVTSVATLGYHAERMERNIRRLQELNPGLLKMYFGQSRLGQKFTETFAGKLSPEEQRLFAELDQDAHTVGTEYERAITGGKPSVSGQRENENRLNWRWNTEESVLASLQEAKALARERLNRLNERYRAALGSGADKDPLYKLYTGYAAKGSFNTTLDANGNVVPAADAGEVGNIPDPDRDTAEYAAKIFRDNEAREWLKQNPNNPLAPQIRQRLGVQ